MNFSKNFFLPCFLFVVFTFPLYGETSDSATVEAGVKNGTSLELQLSSLPEAKLIFTQSFTVPFLQGDNALVEGNNIKFKVGGEVTPISMSFLGEAVFTPIVFIELVAGGMLGSGWNIELFGSEVRGIGLNVPDENNQTSVNGSAFDGTFMGGHFGGAFQFDLAAVIPGDWNHVVFRTYHEAECKIYSRADRGQAWFYESDYGENQNGWNYYGNYLLGYQMPQKPIFLETVGFLVEMKKYLYNTPNGDQWGDSLGRWDFAFLVKFDFTENFSTALITQFRLYRNYRDFTYTNSDDKDPDFNRYYQDRNLGDGGNYKDGFKFYRVAAILNYRLR